MFSFRYLWVSHCEEEYLLLLSVSAASHLFPDSHLAIDLSSFLTKFKFYGQTQYSLHCMNPSTLFPLVLFFFTHLENLQSFLNPLLGLLILAQLENITPLCSSALSKFITNFMQVHKASHHSPALPSKYEFHTFSLNH